MEPPGDTMKPVKLHMRQDSGLLRKIFAEREFSLRITHTISNGRGRWLQAVQAEVLHAESTIPEANLASLIVWVKLYDECFFHQDRDETNGNGDDWDDSHLDL